MLTRPFNSGSSQEEFEMRQKTGMMVLIGGLVLLALTSSSLSAQVSIEDQLKAQYNFAKMGQDSTGYSVVTEGTLLSIQKGGIIGVPYKNMSIRTSTYQDGTVHASDIAGVKNNKFLTAGCGLVHKCPTTPDTVNDETATKLFKVGDKVYPTKIVVDTAKDTVTMTIVACDTCNKTDPPTYEKAQVAFKFAAGTLAKGDVSQIEDTIGQLLAISNDDSQQASNDQGGQNGNNNGGNNNGGNNNGGGNQGGGGGQQQQQQEPQQIGVGQTPDQVKASLGNPDKMVNLGAKQIWVYKDLKVTFMNGKVSDVQ
jgi:uncharacterized membrane protein YgcG